MKHSEHIHVLGICGTFMGGLAALAREAGFVVSGQDQNVYPPMSTQLHKLGISMHQGYDDTPLQESYYDQVVVGNVMTRGMPVIETLLSRKLPFTSGPQWLGERILRHRQVAAVAGTHGKTSTAAMLAWILEANGLQPGFLIGGVPRNFDISARLGQGQAFVIEADEYDSAFFDKRSKFLHYHGDVVILNNLEYDHADIFPDLEAIKTQFHHLVRTIPATGRLVVNGEDANVKDVLMRGCWTPVTTFGRTAEYDVWAEKGDAAGRHICLHAGAHSAEFQWDNSGDHNVMNAAAAAAAALAYGVSLPQSARALAGFVGAKRRMEKMGQAQGVCVYDDFAHHPTAIASTLQGAKNVVGTQGRLLAVFEPRSNSMRAGVHAAQLPAALATADVAFVLMDPQLRWQESARQAVLDSPLQVAESVSDLLQAVRQTVRPGDTVVFMSNGGFDNAPRRFVELLTETDKASA